MGFTPDASGDSVEKVCRDAAELKQICKWIKALAAEWGWCLNRVRGWSVDLDWCMPAPAPKATVEPAIPDSLIPDLSDCPDLRLTNISNVRRRLMSRGFSKNQTARIRSLYQSYRDKYLAFNRNLTATDLPCRNADEFSMLHFHENPWHMYKKGQGRPGRGRGPKRKRSAN